MMIRGGNVVYDVRYELKMRGMGKSRNSVSAVEIPVIELIAQVSDIVDISKNKKLKEFWVGEWGNGDVPKYAVKIKKVDWYSLKGKQPPTCMTSDAPTYVKKYGLTKADQKLLELYLFIDEVHELTEEEYDKRYFFWEV